MKALNLGAQVNGVGGNKMNKEIFERYAEIKNKIKSLTGEAKEIEKEVSVEMEKEDMKSLQSPIGTFSVVVRKSWIYSPAVGLLELDLKKRKKDEEESGDATFKESSGIMFRTKKE